MYPYAFLLAPCATRIWRRRRRDACRDRLLVQDALSQLPDKHRIALVLHHMFSYTYDEAGRLMGVPAGTVKSYVYRGKRAMRHILTGETEDAMR